MTEIMNCPCCGGTASLECRDTHRDTRYRVSCDECLMMTDWMFDPDSARFTWNTRVEPEKTLEDLEKARAYLDKKIELMRMEMSQ